ncbi:hypothetical protein [Mycobacterium sp. SM3041]|uniref:hypothetical protein n=1 Tax=Mycobacterium sp. SM3041 TaxID=3114291 RepID=UPI003204D1DC
MALVAGLAACARQPPPPQSHYVPDATPTQAAVVQAPDSPGSPQVASFVDNFDRPDTDFGLGEGWELRGVPSTGFVLPTTKDGFIKGNYFTYGGTDDVLAIRTLRGTLKSIGAVGRFRMVGLGGLTIFTMGTSGDSDLSANNVSFVSSRTYWALKVRATDGVDKTVAQGQYAVPLELDRDYRFELDTDGVTATVKGTGLAVTKPLPTQITPGSVGCWGLVRSRSPLGQFFDVKTVWAVEDGVASSVIDGEAAGTAH